MNGKNLAIRATSDAIVSLYWDSEADEVYVVINDKTGVTPDRAGNDRVITPGKENALDAFYHPNLYQQVPA